MSGDIIDSNSVMIAQQLKNIGIEVTRKVTVADDLAMLIDEIQHISKQSDVLIINGGLGPTTDDLTAEALACAANTTIEQHDDALTHVTTWCQKRNTPLNKPNLKQTYLPKDCDIIANSVGSAVGFTLTLNNCQIYCTPGVPSELKVMMNEQIMPILKNQLPEQQQAHTTRLQLFGYGESGLQKAINENFSDWPTALEIGYRASMPMLELKVTSRTPNDFNLKTRWVNKIKQFLGDHVVHEITDQPITLAKSVLLLLQQEHQTIVTAESCTGGLIASLLTKEAGASSAFHAGFVTYSNEMKQQLLEVPEQTLSEFGAVSEQTATAMAKGALLKSGSEHVVAVSGIAGPDGGSVEKPVGIICIAWGSRDNIKVNTLNISGNRHFFQQSVAAIALDLIRRTLINSSETPRYLIEKTKKQHLINTTPN
jgi:nicotinamide-nucleotide amidase